MEKHGYFGNLSLNHHEILYLLSLSPIFLTLSYFYFLFFSSSLSLPHFLFLTFFPSFSLLYAFYPFRLKKIVHQTLKALEFIHSLRLIHCDIKVEKEKEGRWRQICHDIEIERRYVHRDRQTDRQTHRQMHRQTDRRTERRTNRQTDR